jgi:murein L,D-transpeptidase YafK
VIAERRARAANAHDAGIIGAVMNFRSSPSCFLVAGGLLLLACASALAEGPLQSSAIASSSVEAALPLADRVVVRKGERKLYLLRGEDVLRTYKVSLGLRPEGHKQYEGDYRTPEGKYRLTRRNPNSEYFLSIQIDYPNEQDIARARKLGLKPGGAIMIHGLPNTPRKPREYYANVDWTEGCIAVSNSDMVEIWLMTPPNTPIEILP